MPRIEFSPAAEADLLEVYEFVRAQGGSERAIAYLGRLERRWTSVLGTLPNAGRWFGHRRRRLRIVSIERRVSLVFRVERDVVQVVRVMYGGRQWPG